MKYINLKNNKTLYISLLIPLIIGFLSYLFSRNGMIYYEYLQKPWFSPPGYLFFIVWTILYLLMGYSSYLIYDSCCYNSRNCLLIYGINLFINFLWSIIFFSLNARLFAFIFIIFLDFVVLFMILCFYGINKKSAYLQIPYFIWLIFATILNFSIYLLNR